MLVLTWCIDLDACGVATKGSGVVVGVQWTALVMMYLVGTRVNFVLCSFYSHLALCSDSTTVAVTVTVVEFTAPILIAEKTDKRVT